MNYKRIYDNIIENAKIKNNDKNRYYEEHHIIPKCLGGNNDSSNLVKLTLREHYIAHKLLAEIYRDNKSIWHAYWMMMISTLGALENIKNENYFRVDGEKLRRIKPILEGEKINITSHEYEYCREYWRNLIKGVKRTDQQRKSISKATKKAMQNSERIKKCRANKGSHYYHEINTGKVHKWFPGDPELDLSKYAWGRGHISNIQKENLSKTQKLNKTICKIGNTNFRYCWYKDYVKKIPNCLIDLHCKQNNSLRAISHHIINALKILKDNDIFLDNDCIFCPNKKGLKIITPAIYEICLSLLENNNLDSLLISKLIYENINTIKELNKIYINNDLLTSDI